jgi:hypothetical protein
MGEQPPSQPPYDPPPPYGPPYGYAGPPPPPPKPGVVPLAPLDLGDVFGGTIQTWLRNWRLVLGLSVVTAAITALLELPFLLDALSGQAAAPRPQSADAVLPELGRLAVLLPLYLLGLWLVTGVAGGMFAVIGRQAVLGRKPTWPQVWRETRPHLLRLVGVSLLVALGSSIALLFCLVPGVIVYTFWSLAIPVVVTEGLTVSQALSRSYRLVLGDGWRVFAILALVFVCTTAASAALSAPFTGAGFLSGSLGASGGVEFAEVASGLAGTVVGSTLTVAFLPFASLLLYVDQRIRRERYDLLLADEASRST